MFGVRTHWTTPRTGYTYRLCGQTPRGLAFESGHCNQTGKGIGMSDELIRLENGISYRQSGDIVADTRVIIESSRHAAQRAVNAALVYRN